MYHRITTIQKSPKPTTKKLTSVYCPIIDLSQDRSTIVGEIRGASSTLGFFQIVSHSISVTLIESMLKDMKNFYEQTTEFKMKFYNREVEKGVTYSTNLDFYQSKAELEGHHLGQVVQAVEVATPLGVIIGQVVQAVEVATPLGVIIGFLVYAYSDMDSSSEKDRLWVNKEQLI
nr:oxoglutarate/iron-dependent dioxygenase [Tanacetum cinerariifolium]